MWTYGISLLWRSAIGFDRVFDMVDAAHHTASDTNRSPFNPTASNVQQPRSEAP
jgi:molecular chaperone IbpA